MKEALIQFRLYVAESLLFWAFDIAPDTNQGNKLKQLIKIYFKDVDIHNR